ncbi:3'(2'),5'-bisphosphate nucleotidase CysQ [Rubripirellula sp.]|nr:3'(2'),5'-bisphosphate nucleotidase CysQ [Rubripirellula sp.]MDB4749870.1 3'(2'),5'-bisphosphate nucleotidase CysQ [Rubripirellula sp.]
MQGIEMWAVQEPRSNYDRVSRACVICSRSDGFRGFSFLGNVLVSIADLDDPAASTNQQLKTFMKLENSQLDKLESIARDAGAGILSVYESEDFNVQSKGDGSPLTRADRLAHEIIVAGLAELTPEIPVVSEESAKEELDARLSWDLFWLVDPLDGTKEFIKRNGEFTVNIALVHRGCPVYGVVYAPVLNSCFCGGPEYGAWRVDGDDSVRQNIAVAGKTEGVMTVVASRSHRGEAVESFIEKLASRCGEPEVRSMGSSLKICLVATGEADVYPRLGPTCEWDTAAAHAVVLGAGGKVTNVCGEPLVYNKPNILNPWFLAFGAGDCEWTEFVPPSSE